LSGGVFDDASVVGEGDDVAVADDVVGGDEGGAVSVGDQLSLIGSDRVNILRPSEINPRSPLFFLVILRKFFFF
jgi:hypothetical protein